MSLEAWSTIAAVGTFLVITGTAITALVQLRHIRRSNQLAGLQSTLEMLQDPSVRELLNYVRHDLSEQMNDEVFRASLREIPINRRNHPELYLCDMYNHVGSYVRSGLIDEHIYLQTEWYNVSLYWRLLHDTIEQLRQNRPYVFENFEWLAARAQDWRDEHPHGDYPKHEHRMLEERRATSDQGVRVLDDKLQLARNVFQLIDEMQTGKAQWSRFDELVTTDFKAYVPGQVLDLDGFKGVMQMFGNAFSNGSHTIAEIVGSDDTVMVYETWKGRHTGAFLGAEPTGKEVAVPVMVLLKFDGNKVREFHETFDTLGLMQKTGVIGSAIH